MNFKVFAEIRARTNLMIDPCKKLFKKQRSKEAQKRPLSILERSANYIPSDRGEFNESNAPILTLFGCLVAEISSLEVAC